MINFLDALYKPKETIEIFDKVILKEGDIVNIYGDPFVGKTLTCYWIIYKNPKYTVLYFDTEATPYSFLYQIGGDYNIVYSTINDIKDICEFIKKMDKAVDYFIIDSLTASVIEGNVDVLLNIFNVIKKNNKNLILVSQIREWNSQIFYEYKKLLDFFSYKAEVKREEDKTIVNGKFAVTQKFLKLKD